MTKKQEGPKRILCPLTWVHKGRPKTIRVLPTKKPGCYTGRCSCGFRFFATEWTPDMGYSDEYCTIQGWDL